MKLTMFIWIVAIVVGIFLLKRFCPRNQLSSDVISALGDELRLRSSSPLTDVVLNQVMRYEPEVIVEHPQDMNSISPGSMRGYTEGHLSMRDIGVMHDPEVINSHRLDNIITSQSDVNVTSTERHRDMNGVYAQSINASIPVRYTDHNNISPVDHGIIQSNPPESSSLQSSLNQGNIIHQGYVPRVYHSNSNSHQSPNHNNIGVTLQDNQDPEGQMSSEYSRFDHIIDIISENRTLPEIPDRSYVTAKDKKHEAKCREVIQRLTGRQFRSVRPDFLKNPKTRRNLEIDCYNDELMLAIEYNGVQHYEWPNFLPMTYDQFLKQVERDALKRDLCERHGVYLIVVPYTIHYDSIEQYIISKLPRKFFRVKEFRNRMKGLYH